MVAATSLMITGCMTNAINAWKLSTFKKTLGTDDPSFILSVNTIRVKSSQYYKKNKGDRYAFYVCDLYNKDVQLPALKESGIIKDYPKCSQGDGPGPDLVIDVGTPREKCIPFINCLDKYIKYKDSDERMLAYSEMKELPFMEAIRYSIGHIKNMVIAANIQANKDNPVWKENLERVCKEDKTLKIVCG
jgi:hypothetical protein